MCAPPSPAAPREPDPTPDAVVPPGWQELPLEHLPAATFWPAGLALAITFILWGFISSWVVLVVGLGLFAASLAGWVNDLHHERKHPS